jgi:hypothetical protein
MLARAASLWPQKQRLLRGSIVIKTSTVAVSAWALCFSESFTPVFNATFYPISAISHNAWQNTYAPNKCDRVNK